MVNVGVPVGLLVFVGVKVLVGGTGVFVEVKVGVAMQAAASISTASKAAGSLEPKL